MSKKRASLSKTSQLRISTPLGIKTLEVVLDCNCDEYPNHVHDAYSLDLLQSGKVNLRIGSRTFLVGVGDIVWLNCKDVHGGTRAGTDQLVLRSILIPPSFVDAVMDPKRKGAYPESRIVSDVHLYAELLNLHQAFEEPLDILDLETRLVDFWFKFFEWE